MLGLAKVLREEEGAPDAAGEDRARASIRADADV